MLVCAFGHGPKLRALSVRVVAERIEHETATVTETLWPSQSENSDAEELAEPRCPPIERTVSCCSDDSDERQVTDAGEPIFLFTVGLVVFFVRILA